MSRVTLLVDTTYENMTIPAGTRGTIIDDDDDLYFGQVVEFDGYPDVYFVERGTIEELKS